MEEKYLIICLRNHMWIKYEAIVFWGKNKCGYTYDLSEAGLYTKEEALQLCDSGDCYISIDKIGITKEMLEFKHKNVIMSVNKTEEICNYVNAFVKIMKNKNRMKYGY